MISEGIGVEHLILGASYCIGFTFGMGSMVFPN